MAEILKLGSMSNTHFGRTLVVILLLLQIAACRSVEIPVLFSPRGEDDPLLTPQVPFMRNLPQGDDSYSQGFRDGCQTFLGVVGTGGLRALPSKIDGFRLTKDRVYARGYSDGSSYCTFYLDYETH